MGTDWAAFGIMVLLLLLPAAVVLGIFYLLNERRGRVPRQRITKRRSHKHDEPKKTDD